VKDLLSLTKLELQKNQIFDWAYTEESRPKTFDYYKKWVKDNHQGPLDYLADHRKDLREDIKNFFPDFKSALVFLFDYTPSAKANIESKNFKFASYTKGFEGFDYHYWIKEKLIEIAAKLNLQNYSLSIDAQPVLERDLAFRAGLGWFGKNSMLISREGGSFFLISSILLSEKLNLETNNTETDHCGNCTRCIDACPTNAILDNRTILAKNCISTFTIELFKDAEAPKGYPTKRGEIFGCDICQEVCPWNQKPLKRVESISEVDFEKKFKETDLESISNREFRRIFKGTSLERTGRVGLLKNLKKFTS